MSHRGELCVPDLPGKLEDFRADSEPLLHVG